MAVRSESTYNSNTGEISQKNKDTGLDTKSKNSTGINQEGLVTNSCNLGDTEIVEVADNLYYESVDVTQSSNNREGLRTNHRNLGETEIVEVKDNL